MVRPLAVFLFSSSGKRVIPGHQPKKCYLVLNQRNQNLLKVSKIKRFLSHPLGNDKEGLIRCMETNLFDLQFILTYEGKKCHFFIVHFSRIHPLDPRKQCQLALQTFYYHSQPHPPDPTIISKVNSSTG